MQTFTIGVVLQELRRVPVTVALESFSPSCNRSPLNKAPSLPSLLCPPQLFKMTKLIVAILLAALSSCLALPQQQPQQQAAHDYDYVYDDVLGTPDFQQPVPQAPVVEDRPRSRQQAQAVQPAPAPSRQQPSRQQGLAGPGEAETTTYIPILKESSRTDPVTGAFIYDYMGADGSGKFEARFPNGTVVGNFTYINDAGERETRWYSAGKRGTEISGDSVISPAPPTLVDETTGVNYVDLSNYDLYRHLEVPYVHIAGPSDPNERGQISAQDDRRFQDQRSQSSQPRPRQQQQQPQQQVQQQQFEQVPIDFGDDTRFEAQPQQNEEFSQQPLESQRPSRVSRTRVRVVDNAAPAPAPAQPRPAAQFDASALDTSSPQQCPGLPDQAVPVKTLQRVPSK